MYKKINKRILLIGCGAMGLAHLKSLISINKKNILILEKNLERINFIKKNYNLRNITVSKKMPKNHFFDFCIIATHSYNRLEILKTLLKNNSVKYLLIEKFIFLKKKHYSIAKRLFLRKKVRVYVNIWSKQLIKICNLNKIKNIFSIQIKIRQGRILTNLVHYLNLIKNLINKKVEINFRNYKFKNQKFNNHIFTEYFGKILITLNNKTIGTIEPSKDNYDYIILKGKNFYNEIQVRDKEIFFNKGFKKKKY